MPENFNICDFPVSNGSIDDHVAWVVERAGNEGGWMVTLNTEMLARTRDDADYGALLRAADILVADGMPIVWGINRKHGRKLVQDRTTGVDLVEKILRDQDTPFAVIGGVDPMATIEQYPNAAQRCRYLFRGVVDFSQQQTALFIDELRKSGASLVLLALGIPKQDKLAKLLREQLDGAVLIGIGGTFEILSNTGGRAPRWMQRAGLEWLYRLGKEPRRLWYRYLVHYPKGIRMLLADMK